MSADITEAALCQLCEKLPELLPARRRTIRREVQDLVSTVRRIRIHQKSVKALGLKRVGTTAAFTELKELRKQAVTLQTRIDTLSIDARLALRPITDKPNDEGSSLGFLSEELERLAAVAGNAQRLLAKAPRIPRPSHRRKDAEVQIAMRIRDLYTHLTGKHLTRSNDASTGKPNGSLIPFLDSALQKLGIKATGAQMVDLIYRRTRPPIKPRKTVKPIRIGK